MCFYGYRNLNWYKQYHQDPTYPKPHPTGNSKLIILAAIAKMPPIIIFIYIKILLMLYLS